MLGAAATAAEGKKKGVGVDSGASLDEEIVLAVLGTLERPPPPPPHSPSLKSAPVPPASAEATEAAGTVPSPFARPVLERQSSVDAALEEMQLPGLRDGELGPGEPALPPPPARRGAGREGGLREGAWGAGLDGGLDFGTIGGRRLGTAGRPAPPPACSAAFCASSSIARISSTDTEISWSSSSSALSAPGAAATSRSA